jgi:hypothetical protein
MRGKIGTKNCFGPKSEVPFVTVQSRPQAGCGVCGWSATCDFWVTQLQFEAWWEQESISAWRVKCPLLLFDFYHTCAVCGTCGWSATCGVWVTRLQCEATGTRNCFGLKSKVPFVTALFRPNLHWLWIMWRECHVWCFIYHSAMRSQIGTRNWNPSVLKVTLLLRPKEFFVRISPCIAVGWLKYTTWHSLRMRNK